mmetsp:Transcript_12671/g.19970  ORF Transcript_12671/g.19970 Transcript_12671/m.19970 type:complete len:95 (-) Transcript_12671:186-470(-)
MTPTQVFTQLQPQLHSLRNRITIQSTFLKKNLLKIPILLKKDYQLRICVLKAKNLSKTNKPEKTAKIQVFVFKMKKIKRTRITSLKLENFSISR